MAILGSENLAIDTALLTLEMGAENIYLVTARKYGPVDSSHDRLEAARGAGIKVLTNRKIVEIFGDGRVESLRAPVSMGGHTGEQDEESGGAAGVLKVGTVIIAGDREPSPDLSSYLAGQLEMNGDGTIEIDQRTLATSRPGVFAGGEIVSGGGLVAEACEQGRRAARSIDRYLCLRPAKIDSHLQEYSPESS